MRKMYKVKTGNRQGFEALVISLKDDRRQEIHDWLDREISPGIEEEDDADIVFGPLPAKWNALYSDSGAKNSIVEKLNADYLHRMKISTSSLPRKSRVSQKYSTNPPI
jgi:hypothetical protein